MAPTLSYTISQVALSISFATAALTALYALPIWRESENKHDESTATTYSLIFGGSLLVVVLTLTLMIMVRDGTLRLLE